MDAESSRSPARAQPDSGKKKRRWRRNKKDEQGNDKDLESGGIDDSLMSQQDLQDVRQAEECLKRDCIYRLRKRPRRYPTAAYTCKLCDLFLECIASAQKHIKERRHKKNVQEKEEEELLITLLPPTMPQIEVIDLAIEKIVQEFGLNNEDLEKRLEIKTLMENHIQQMLPVSSLRLYGSSSTRFGFKNSDLNIDIEFPDSMAQPDVLLLVQESLKNSDTFIDVDTDFHARVPVVVCREKQSGLLCKVSAGNDSACLTTNHLAALGRLEPSLVSLVVAFRYWAKLCRIDSPEEGGLPPYVFALMAVFFLQQRNNPILPVYLGSWIEGFSFRKIVHFNLLAVENNEVVWEHNPASLDDTRPSDEQSVRRGKASLVIDTERPCLVPVGQLWVELLRFYTVEFNFEDLVISIRFKEAMSRESKDWPKKRVAVEDPYSLKRNVARSLNSQLMFEYMLHCLRVTYKYFALPHKKSTISSPRKPICTDLQMSQKQESKIKQCTSDGQVGNNLHVINKKLEHVNLEEHVSAHNITNDSHKVFDSDSQTEEELAEDIGNIDSDCVTKEVLLDELEKREPNYEDAESGNEYEDEQDKDITFDHALDDCENGETVTLGLERDETDSISDVEGFQNVAMTESDECGTLDDKMEFEEESTEGTDELEGPLNTFVLSRCGKTSEQNNLEEAKEILSLKQADYLDSLSVGEEMNNTYTGSADEDALSEEGEQSQITSKCQDFKELKKPVNECIKTDGLTEGDFTLHEDDLSMDCLKERSADCDLFYEFSRRAFTKGKSPTVVCSLCKRDGHLQKDCPEDFKKIELDPLPKMTPKFQTILDQVCIQCFNDFSPDALEDQAKEYIRQNLEHFIKEEFQGTKGSVKPGKARMKRQDGRGTVLSLFGSSKNGFGFKQSDLDICMTLDGYETAEGLDCARTIEELARVLRKHSGLRNILPITTAKVPIVKFFHVRSGLEGDISLYNTLALHNTRLLAAYATIDSRVKYLCYIMKVFTKMCDIGDASRGSLSSYAYTLMVLYFLQQRNPPVIPVLQEIYDGHRKPEILVEGWNVYFFDKLQELSNYWPGYGKNTESVGELWLALLRFYTEEFDFKEHVVCIRRKSLLTTFKKQWTSKYIVIEDPFDLNHNLGAGLSRKMTYFIMKAFINGRRVFGTPVKSFPKEYPTKMEYFFDPEVLTEGELAPNDRCCRICGKIGHFMKECPMRRKFRRRREHDGTMNQRNPETSLQRNDQDKDTQCKNADKEISARDGRTQPPCTPPKHRQEGWGAHETGRDKTPRLTPERWRRQEDRDLKERRCFVCGREGHVKKDCPQYRTSGLSKSDGLFGSPSSPSSMKQAGRLHEMMHLYEEKRKQQGKISMSTQSGSPSSKSMAQGKPSQKRAPEES